MDKRFSWLGVLLVATISGLIVRIVGDPLVELTTPEIKDFLDNLGDRTEDKVEDIQDWFERD